MIEMLKQEDDPSIHVWGNMEKETLKKYLLIYGYGRWSKIRKISAATCKILKNKTDVEMKAHANDFVGTLYEHLQTEKNELKGFLMNLIEDSAQDPFVHNPAKEWGEVISQRATPWGKRL